MDFVLASIILILIMVVLMQFIKGDKQTQRISKYIDNLPGEKWYPIVGTAWNIMRTDRSTFFDALKSMHFKFGPFYRSWLGSKPVVYIYKPEHAQVILRSNTTTSKGQSYKFLFPWLGHGLISGSGPKWKEHRKIITPAFHFNVLETYARTFVEKSDIFVEYLKRFEGKGYFEVTEYLTRIALDIICVIAGQVSQSVMMLTPISPNYESKLTNRCYRLEQFDLNIIIEDCTNPSTPKFQDGLEKGAIMIRGTSASAKYNYGIETTACVGVRRIILPNRPGQSEQNQQTAMGVKFNFLENEDGRDSEYANAIIDFCTILYRRIYNPFYANDLTFKMTKLGRKSQKCLDTLHKVNSHVFRTRKELFQKHKDDILVEDELGRRPKMSFLDMLLAHQVKSNFQDREIEEEVNTFIFAGMDTTAWTLSYTFMALGNYLDIQKRVHAELDEIFADAPDRKVTAQDISRMDYLDRVIKEVLRCYCFVPYMLRQIEEDVEIDGVLIPKGVSLNISLYDLHHDSDHWPEPFKFDPDRFLPENVAKRHPYAFVPFSAGPRNCLGQKFAMRNVKTLISTILRKYKLTCQEKPEDVKYFLEVVLRPQNGLHITLEPRR